jgi:hypothetical protein
MAGNQLITEIAAEARGLGWEPPGGIDHVTYVRRAVAVMWALSFELRGSGPSWLTHAYGKEADDLSPRLPGGRYQALLDEAMRHAPTLAANPLAYDLAVAAPSRWAAEVALLAEGRRRTGRAQSLIRSCARIQLAMTRNGVAPVGRASGRDGVAERLWVPIGRARANAARLRGDGRGRGLFLLAREAEIWRERESELLWGPLVSPARPVARRAGEGRAEPGPVGPVGPVDEIDDEGWGG